MINNIYEVRKEALSKALEEKDALRLCIVYERPWRMTGLMRSHELVSSKKFWEAAKWVWIDSENVWQNVDQWKEVFKLKDSHLFMSRTEQLKLQAFFETKDKLTIWRGGDHDGLSYTISEEKAHWFSKRFRGSGKVYEKEVYREQVFAYTDDRNEQEIILRDMI